MPQEGEVVLVYSGPLGGFWCIDFNGVFEFI